jgi:hypothetical protein
MARNSARGVRIARSYAPVIVGIGWNLPIPGAATGLHGADWDA